MFEAGANANNWLIFLEEINHTVINFHKIIIIILAKYSFLMYNIYKK